jgi:multiple sugar transport system permease protein
MLMAGSVIALLPVLLIYLVGQKWFVQGIALSGMGGR